MNFNFYVINNGEEVDNFKVTVAYKIYGDKTYYAKHRRIDQSKYIFIYTLEGEGCIEIDGVYHYVREKQLMMINGKKSISYWAHGQTWNIWLFEYKVKEHSLPTNCTIDVTLLPWELQLCHLCLESLKKGAYKQASAYFACIYYSALEKITKKDYKKEKFQEATNYMKEHLEDCRIADVAEHVELSERALRHLFKLNTDLLPKQYLEHLRIEEAKKLLETGDMFIKDIANQLGFSTPYHFSECFKKVSGVSPKYYRNSAKYLN